MTINWVEEICNKPGLCTGDRALMRKLADEVYRLTEQYETINHLEYQKMDNTINELRKEVEGLSAQLLMAKTEIEVNKIAAEKLQLEKENLNKDDLLKKRGRPKKPD